MDWSSFSSNSHHPSSRFDTIIIIIVQTDATLINKYLSGAEVVEPISDNANHFDCYLVQIGDYQQIVYYIQIEDAMNLLLTN